MSSCLITGGNGFIGKHLVHYLLRQGRYDRIYVLDIVHSDFFHPAVIQLQADIREPLSLKLPEDCTVCFHLAAIAKEPGFTWEEYFSVNHAGTRNLCVALRNSPVCNVVFTSTMMVYRAGEARREETSLACPDTAYGISKLLAEETLWAWLQMNQNRRLRIVRPGIVFGPGENGNFTRLYRALRFGVFHYVGRRTTVKSSIYVKDLVRCLDFLSSDGGQDVIFNAVLPQTHTIEDICRTFQDVFNFRRVIPVLPYRLSLAGAYAFELVDAIGLHTPIHHRRIEKLYHSTDLSAQRLCNSGFRFEFDLRSAISDWKASCHPDDIF